MAGLNILKGLTGNVKSAVGHVGNATKSMGTAGNLIWDNKINAGLATANAVWTYNDTLDEGGTSRYGSSSCLLWWTSFSRHC